MKRFRTMSPVVLAALAAFAGTAQAGAPTPDVRGGAYRYVCKGGANKGSLCTVATEAADCPRSACVLAAVSKKIRGTLTIVVDDLVRDWKQGTGGPRALTLLLELKAPDGTKHLLAETYQDLVDPTQPPTLPTNVVSIPVDEAELKTLAASLNGLLLVQAEANMADRLRALFNTTGTPVLVDLKATRAQFSDQTATPLASALRFKVEIQFVEVS